MQFNALHRALGREPGPMTDDMLDEAVVQRVREADDLDWKRALPEEKSLAQSDLLKDIAAMANSGGGVIVYGVEEEQRAASGRRDVGEVSESYERTLRRVAVSGLQPPVFGLGVHSLGEGAPRALVLVVPTTSDAPHLIYKGEYFGAPIRNNADTEWMRERQLEAMYLARLNERRTAAAALTDLYGEISSAHEAVERAWIVGVARPRVPSQPVSRMSRDNARVVLGDAMALAPNYADNKGIHPMESIDYRNPRPGLRRWVAPTSTERSESAWKEAWATVHDDGSVTLAAAIGAARRGDGADPAWLVDAERAERFTGDLMALLRASSNHQGTGDYEIRVGIEWRGSQPLVIQTRDSMGFAFTGTSIPISRFVPVTMSIRTDLDLEGFRRQVWELATDVVNQGGVQYLRAVEPPDRSSSDED